MGVTGDFAGLAKLGQMLKSFEPNRKELARKVAVRFAPALSKFILAEFATGSDPYGQPFKPLSPKTIAGGRKPPPMTDTGKARSEGALVVATGVADRATFPDYIRYHLTTGRALLPAKGQPWPATWLEAIRELAAASAKAMAGAAR